MEALKESLKKDRNFERIISDEQIRILERLLVDSRFQYSIGEITEEEWRSRSLILTRGIDSIRNRNKSGVAKARKFSNRPVPPPSTPPFTPSPLVKDIEKVQLLKEKETAPFLLKESERFKKEPTDQKEARRNLGEVLTDRSRKRRVKAPPELDRSSRLRVRCMNPWKPDCRNTDIGLSIYYKDEFLPICTKCWKEISEKNLQWSSS